MSELSKQKVVNILRILYPVWMIVGMFGVMYVPSQLIVSGNIIETASKILSNELLFRSGVVSSIITQLVFIFAVIFLYKLFESVNKNQASLMAVFGLISVPIAIMNEINSIGALISLNNPGQVMMFLNLHTQGIVIASMFWGLWLFPLGYLIYKSGYFPKAIGIAVVIGGAGYLASFFIKLLVPSSEFLLSLFDFMTFGEIIFVFWLLFVGAKLEKIK